MDLKNGLICEHSGEQANFETSCDLFQIDETIRLQPLNNDELTPEELKVQLSSSMIEKLKSEQNYFKGILSGITAGLVCAFLWAQICIFSGLVISAMAIGVGLVVGLTIRLVGNGIEKKFGYWGAIISLFSCFLGDILAIIGFVAKANDLPFFEMLIFRFNYSELPSFFMETLNFKDFLFYIFYSFALAFGYRFSFRKITANKIAEMESK